MFIDLKYVIDIPSLVITLWPKPTIVTESRETQILNLYISDS